MDKQQIIAAVFSGAFTKALVDGVKKALPQGSKSKGRLIVSVPYEIKKGLDYDTAPTTNLLSQAVLAKALVYSGVTVDAYKKALTRAAKEAIENKVKVADIISEDERVAEMIQQVQSDVVQMLPRQPRNGVVKVNILTPDKMPIILKHEIDL